MNKKLIEEIRSYYDDIYGPYGIYMYVPMAEASGLYIPVTMGCSYNKCLYCELNQSIDFKFLGMGKIEDNLRKLDFINSHNKRKVKKVVLLAGNPFVLKTDKLIKISELIRKYFPYVEYISCFARADDILSKSISELELLKDAGYDRLSLGIESGSDKILNFHRKGLSSKDNLNALRKLEKVNIDYSTYIMLGLGGREWSLEHALETSKLLNQVQPYEINLVSLVLFKNADLIDEVRAGNFTRPRPLELLKEEYSLIENLYMEDVLLNASHKTNIIPLKGILPKQKDFLLGEIEKAIKNLEDKDLGKYEHKRWKKWGLE